jgi:hypothetical protein
MTRLLTVAVALVVAHAADAQCQPWYPVYPVAPPAYHLTPAVWGAPAPKPLPPALPPVPPRAKAIPSIKEEDEPPLAPEKPADKSKAGAKDAGDEKDKDSPRIPKTKLPIPGDRLDKGLPDLLKGDSPKVEPPKKDDPATKPFEQYVIPAEGKGEPQAQVKVGFFNHTDRPLVLDVNGQPVRLPKGEYVTMRLPRTFSWAEQGAKDQSVVVPPDADGIEIVFRK